ncbi:MAG: hypothetical protein IJU52_09750 [Clostridia bacterium]|nr:hypothetical protein [Clostridia bacterium]
MKKRLKILMALLVCLALCLPTWTALSPVAGFGEEGVEKPSPAHSALYDLLLDALQNNLPDENNCIPVDLTGMGITREIMKREVKKVADQNPEYFYFIGGYACFPVDKNGFLQKILLVTEYSGDELVQKTAEFEALTAPLFALHNDSWSDFETVLFYHDYLSSNYEYDYTYSIHHPKEFLEQGRGVCNAFAKVFQLLMNRFGVPCISAQSDILNHIWNVVYLDGAWYHIDVTWSDLTAPGPARHKYFLTGTDMLAQDPQKSPATDIDYGAQIETSVDDHPLYSLFCNVNAPCTSVGGRIYTVVETGGGFFLSEYDAASGAFLPLLEMPSSWRIPNGGGTYHPGCYSTLVSLGGYILYNDDMTVKALDLATLEQTDVTGCGEETCICGMRFVGDTLTAFLSAKLYGDSFDPMPVFRRGDIDGDFLLSITDVTVLLDVLGGSGSGVLPFISDVDGNGVSQIGDVTALLDTLAA